MDDTFIHSTAEEHMDDLMDLFKVLRKYGLKLSPHKCQFFKKKSTWCKAQPRRASLGHPFHNMAAHTEAMPTREGI